MPDEFPQNPPRPSNVKISIPGSRPDSVLPIEQMLIAINQRRNIFDREVDVILGWDYFALLRNSAPMGIQDITNQGSPSVVGKLRIHELDGSMDEFIVNDVKLNKPSQSIFFIDNERNAAGYINAAIHEYRQTLTLNSSAGRFISARPFPEKVTIAMLDDAMLSALAHKDMNALRQSLAYKTLDTLAQMNGRHIASIEVVALFNKDGTLSRGFGISAVMAWGREGAAIIPQPNYVRLLQQEIQSVLALGNELDGADGRGDDVDNFLDGVTRASREDVQNWGEDVNHANLENTLDRPRTRFERFAERMHAYTSNDILARKNRFVIYSKEQWIEALRREFPEVRLGRITDFVESLVSANINRQIASNPNLAFLTGPERIPNRVDPSIGPMDAENLAELPNYHYERVTRVLSNDGPALALPANASPTNMEIAKSAEIDILLNRLEQKLATRITPEYRAAIRHWWMNRDLNLPFKDLDGNWTQYGRNMTDGAWKMQLLKEAVEVLERYGTDSVAEARRIIGLSLDALELEVRRIAEAGESVMTRVQLRQFIISHITQYAHDGSLLLDNYQLFNEIIDSVSLYVDTTRWPALAKGVLPLLEGGPLAGAYLLPNMDVSSPRVDELRRLILVREERLMRQKLLRELRQLREDVDFLDEVYQVRFPTEELNAILAGRPSDRFIKVRNFIRSLDVINDSNALSLRYSLSEGYRNLIISELMDGKTARFDKFNAYLEFYGKYLTGAENGTTFTKQIKGFTSEFAKGLSEAERTALQAEYFITQARLTDMERDILLFIYDKIINATEFNRQRLIDLFDTILSTKIIRGLPNADGSIASLFQDKKVKSFFTLYLDFKSVIEEEHDIARGFRLSAQGNLERWNKNSTSTPWVTMTEKEVEEFILANNNLDLDGLPHFEIVYPEIDSNGIIISKVKQAQREKIWEIMHARKIYEAKQKEAAILKALGFPEGQTLDQIISGILQGKNRSAQLLAQSIEEAVRDLRAAKATSQAAEEVAAAKKAKDAATAAGIAAKEALKHRIIMGLGITTTLYELLINGADRPSTVKVWDTQLDLATRNKSAIRAFFELEARMKLENPPKYELFTDKSLATILAITMNDSSNCAVALSELDELNRFYNNELTKLNDKVKKLFNEKVAKPHEAWHGVRATESLYGERLANDTYRLPSAYMLYNDITDDNITRLELESAIHKIEFAKNMLELFKNKGNITARLLQYVKIKLAGSYSVGKSADEDIKLFVSIFGQMPITPAIETFLLKIQQKQITAAEMTSMMCRVWPFIQGFEYDDAMKSKRKKLFIRTVLTVLGNVAGYASGFAYIGMWDKLSKLYQVASKMPSLMTIGFAALSLGDWLGEFNAAKESYLLTPNSWICPSPQHESLTLDKDSASNTLYRWTKQIEEFAESSIERGVAILEVFKNTDAEFAERYEKFLSAQTEYKAFLVTQDNVKENTNIFLSKLSNNIFHNYMNWKSIYCKDVDLTAIGQIESWREATFSFEKHIDKKIKALYAYINNKDYSLEDINVIKSMSPGFDMDDKALTYREKRMKLIPILNAMFAKETRFARLISNALDTKLLAEFIKRAREIGGRVEVIEAEFRNSNTLVQEVIKQVVEKIKLIPFFRPAKIVAPVKVEVPDSTRPGGALLATVAPEGPGAIPIEEQGNAGSVVIVTPIKPEMSEEMAKEKFSSEIKALRTALESKDDKGIAGENSRKFLVQNQIRIEQQIRDYNNGATIVKIMTKAEEDAESVIPPNQNGVSVFEGKSTLEKIGLAINSAADSILKNVIKPVKLTAEQMADNQLTASERAFAKKTARTALQMFELRTSALHGGEVAISILTKGDVLRAEDADIAKAALEEINAKIAEEKKAADAERELITEINKKIAEQLKIEQDARDAAHRKLIEDLDAIGPWYKEEADKIESEFYRSIADATTEESIAKTNAYNALPDYMRISTLKSYQRENGIAKYEGRAHKKQDAPDIAYPTGYDAKKLAKEAEIKRLSREVDAALAEAVKAKIEMDRLLLKESGAGKMTEGKEMFGDEDGFKKNSREQTIYDAIKKQKELDKKYKDLKAELDKKQGNNPVVPINNSGNEPKHAQNTHKNKVKEVVDSTVKEKGADYTAKYAKAYEKASIDRGTAISIIKSLGDDEKKELENAKSSAEKKAISEKYSKKSQEAFAILNEADAFMDKYGKEYDDGYSKAMQDEGFKGDYKATKEWAKSYKVGGSKFDNRAANKKAGTWTPEQEKQYKKSSEKSREEENKADAANSKVYAWMQQHAGGREKDKSDALERNIIIHGKGGQGGKQKKNGHSYGCKCKKCFVSDKDSNDKIKKAFDDKVKKDLEKIAKLNAANKDAEEKAKRAAFLADLIRALDEEKLKRETEKRLNTIIPFGTFEDWYTDKDGNLKPKLKSFGEQILNPIPLFTLANLPEIPEWPNGATFISLPTKVIPMILVKRLNDININLDFNKSQSTSITDNPAANIIPTSLPIYVNFKGPSSLLGAAGSAVAEEQHGWKPSDFANLVDPIRFGGNDINIHINTNPKVVIPPIPPILPPPLDNTPVKGSAEILSEEVNTVMPIKNVMHGIKVDLGPI